LEIRALGNVRDRMRTRNRCPDRYLQGFRRWGGRREFACGAWIDIGDDRLVLRVAPT
jgi:hypothetical protein